MTRVLLVLAFAASACAHTAPESVGPARFRNQAPVWVVNDRMDVPEKPEELEFMPAIYFFDRLLYARFDDAMALEPPRRALNVNAMDEVPSSTWWNHRIGARRLTREEVLQGPNEFPEGPATDAPWTVTSGKTGGTAVGFVIKDSRGHPYLMKFDEKGFPVVETASDVVAQRLLWALGYNVPENSVVYFTRDQIVIGEGATSKDAFGNREPITEKAVDRALSKVNQLPDGRYRALASRYVSGVPLGGFPQEGTREDDPNDRIPHEHRREVRALGIFLGWLLHTDLKQDNTLDMWIEDGDKHYVKHYLVDFGRALGTSGVLDARVAEGYRHYFDFEYFVKSFPALGLYVRPWEGADIEPVKEVGNYNVEYYRQDKWRSHAPYVPLNFLDPADSYWAAKKVIALTPDLLDAAVTMAKYENPEAHRYVVKTLRGRAVKLARWAFAKVSPLDHFVLDGRGLCFADLGRVHALTEEETFVDLRAYGHDGTPLDWQTTATPETDGTGCVAGFPRGETNAGYTIIRLALTRAGDVRPPVEVHLADGPDGTPRIIGVYRHFRD